MNTGTIRIHPAGARGKVELGRLSSRHSLFFGHSDDPEHKGFRSVRVIGTGRQVWMQVIEGTVGINGRRPAEGRGAAIEEPGNPIVTGVDDWSDVLLIHLA